MFNSFQLFQAEEANYEIVLKIFEEYCIPYKTKTDESYVFKESTKRK